MEMMEVVEAESVTGAGSGMGSRGEGSEKLIVGKVARGSAGMSGTGSWVDRET